MPREINSVGVVGGGLMGAGIAEVSAVAGMPVVVRDLPQFLDAARARVEKSLAGAVKHGKMDQAERDEVLARITFTPDLKDVAGADIVIEAVPEILDLKVSLIRELDELVSPGNVIATNTSSIPIAELAGKVQHPGRVVGVHFFSPVPVMKLVEIVVALDTDPETAETAFAFAAKAGQAPHPDQGPVGLHRQFPAHRVRQWPPSGCMRRASPAGRTSTTACASARVTRWAR